MKDKSRIPTNLFEAFSLTAAEGSTRTAVIDGEPISYKQLNRLVQTASLEIRRRGVGRGDRVAILMPNSLEFVVAYFAILGAGAVVVPLNEQYQLNEILFAVDESQVKLIITEAGNLSLCQEVVHLSACKPGVVTTAETGGLNRSADTEAGFSPITMEADAPVMIQFSSGSTGAPKRIARTHANLLFELDSLRKTLSIRKEDRFLGVAPFSHVNGLVRTMLLSMTSGATLVPLRKFERQRAVRALVDERISVFIAVPFMFSVLAQMRLSGRPDFSALRLCISASAPMPENLNRDFAAKFGLYVRQLYGSTETGSISANLEYDPEPSLRAVGKPVQGVEVSVYLDDGSLAAPGEMGEFGVRSPGVVGGYLDLPELNRVTFREGYFLTGDLGRKEEDGTLFLLGRKKFFINKGGYKINPAEIEEVLETYPAVAEVAVIGVPTPLGDEKVKAVVICRTPCQEVELIDHCRGKIADFKIPSVIEFRDELPKTATGKIRKKMLLD
ncbi:MAG: acyl--CoA ligase [Acidobacteriota bacterium]|nr:MAG: acyl--CoA ligase [Acidobacteriota bacterium]